MTDFRLGDRVRLKPMYASEPFPQGGVITGIITIPLHGQILTLENNSRKILGGYYELVQ